jgi:asparagine synthase (glutamine-hydrolysing)
MAARMKRIFSGSSLGESPYYIALHRDTHASTIRALLGLLDKGDHRARAIDPVGLRQYFDRSPDGERTCFHNARLLPAGFDLCHDGNIFRVHRRELPESNGTLLPLLELVLAEQLARVRKPIVALSGGVDSALVLALVRRLTGNAIPVVTLATNFPGYCELKQTRETAHALGVGSMEVISADPQDFLDALPDTIAACETPLFNLHPVSKLLLARAVARNGHDALITGDGADQVFAGADGRNYLPIVGALVREAGITLLSPFLDERVIAHAEGDKNDREKTVLRRAAATIMPAELAWRQKSPRLAPEFNLNDRRDSQLESHLAPTIGRRAPDRTSGPEQTLWATTAILVRHLGGTC